MNVHFNNLGSLNFGTVELGDLTIICGENQTVKSDILRCIGTVFNDLTRDQWKYFEDLSLYTKHELLHFSIDLQSSVDKLDQITNDQISKTYSEKPLSSLDRLKKTKITLSNCLDKSWLDKKLTLSTIPNDWREHTKQSGSPIVELSLEKAHDLYNSRELYMSSQEFEHLVSYTICKELQNLVFSGFSDVFTIKENRVNADTYIDQVKHDKRLGFSEIIQKNPRTYELLQNILSGDFQLADNDILYFIQGKTKTDINQTTAEIKSFVPLWNWLRHRAHVNDLLIIDQPELYLHPDKQRKIAVLIAALVNAGVKVLISTNSDYIIKEVNTLIMLNSDKPHLESIRVKHGYTNNDRLQDTQVRAYDTATNRKGNAVLKKLKIVSTLGIEAISFDKVINHMNNIYDEILYGERF